MSQTDHFLSDVFPTNVSEFKSDKIASEPKKQDTRDHELLRISADLASPLLKGLFKNKTIGAAWVAQRFSSAFGPGPDPGDSGLSPTSASFMEPASPSALVSASLSLCVFHE